jgi:HlyD family secretion protein
MRRLILGLGLVGLVILLAAANLWRDPRGTTLDWQLIKAPPREVHTEPLARGLIVQTVAAPGTVEAVEEAQIASQVLGRVVAVRVRDGDRVRAGDLLVQLDDTEARARLESARARVDRLSRAVEQARAELEKAARDADRQERLANRGVATPTELADARTAWTKAVKALEMGQNELAESRALLRTAEQDLSYTEIRAPIDGVVSGLDVEVGEVVIAGTTNLPGTVLMTVADPSRMRVRANVDEADVGLVHDGQPVWVYLQSDLTRAVPGLVDRVAPKGKKTEEVVSFETLIDVTTDPAVRPGMTATVEIEVRRAEDALGVPVQAVVHRRLKDLPDTPAFRSWSDRHARAPAERGFDPEARYLPIVFVVEAGVARARPVETGLSDERRIEVLSGVDPDDHVVVGPFRALDELRDGDPVGPAPSAGDPSAM